MEEFVENHLKLLELERNEEISNSQSLMNSSPKVLESKGLCLQRMRLTNLRTGLYGRTIAEFNYNVVPPPRDLPANTFSSGDLVGVYSEKAPFSPTEEATVVSAVMLKLSARSASLVLDDSTNAESLDDGGMYRLVKLGSDVTYKRIKKGLKALLSKSQNCPASHLVDILFGSDVPSPTPPLPNLTFFNSGLDSSQREAVAFALSRPDVAVIHGPPGTGKTTTVIELIRQALLSTMGSRKTRILACAPSNVAVDNLLERLAVSKPQPRLVRLGHTARVLPHIQRFSLEAQLANSDGWQLVKDVQREMDEVRRRMTKKSGRDRKHGDEGGSFRLRHEMADLRRELREREAKALQEIYDRSEVVLSTLTGLHEDKTLQKVEFDLVIIDECSQSVEAACWLALLRASRCILAGDHLQLPPTVLSKEAAAAGLDLSLMERVLRLYPGDQVTRMLTTQYRMHEDIMGWSADQFYEGRLEAHPSVAKHGLRDLPHVRAPEEEWEEEIDAAVVLVDTAGCGVAETVVEQSRGNVGEAELVRFLAEQRVTQFGLREEEVGVITPYNLQVELIRNRLKPRFPGMEIRTVDGFQGREKEVILLSLVRSNAQGEVGFLAEHRRLNVAVTRARRQVVVVCDTDTLTRGKDAVLRRFVEYLRDRAAVVHSAQELIDAGDVDIGSVLANDFASVENGEAGQEKAGSKKKNKNRNKAKKEARGGEKSFSGKPRTKEEGTKPTKEERPKPPTAEEKEVEEEEFRKQLITFCNSEEQGKHFPNTLNSRQRAIIHELAEELKLVHISSGEGKDRHIMVKKQSHLPETAAESLEAADTSEIPQPDQPSAMSYPRPASPQTAARPVSPEASTSHPESSPAFTSPQNAQETSIMRQLREYRAREQQQRAEQENRKSAARSGRAGSALSDVAGDDFDALLAAAERMDSICARDGCPTKVRTLGHQCRLCNRRFCSSHFTPEAHGCGAAARDAARRSVAREGKLYAGSGVPNKKPDPTRRAHLERRLDRRIDELAEQRKAKEGKKKKK